MSSTGLTTSTVHSPSHLPVLRQAGAVLLLVGIAGAFALGVFCGRRQAGPETTVPGNTPPAVERGLPLKPGPWGKLEYFPIYIEPPAEYLPVQALEQADVRWLFNGYSPAQLGTLIEQLDLSDEWRAEFFDPARCVITTNGVIVTPSRELVLGLAPTQRKALYSVSTRLTPKPIGDFRVVIPADRFDDWFAQSGLAPATVNLVKQLCYPHGKLLLFCDPKPVLESLTSTDEKLRLLKTLLRKPTMLVEVQLRPDTDVRALLDYWGYPKWGEDLRPLLDSIVRLPHGAWLDLIEMLPPMPSARLYTFSLPSLDPAEAHKDCHWTALNFFRDPPSQEFTDAKIVEAAFGKDYYPVPGDPRYGDILTLRRPNGQIIHSAVYIAADIVYTKNSPSFMEPFMLMRIPDMLDNFQAQVPEGEQLQTLYFRGKSH